MKYITLIIGLLVVGCGKQEQTDTNESTPTTNTNKVNGTTAKPTKELTLEEKVIGEYELKKNGVTSRRVFLENGVMEWYINGKKEDEEAKWSISKEGELHLTYQLGDIGVFSINKDESITGIADIYGEKRTDYSKESQITYKKIK